MKIHEFSDKLKKLPPYLFAQIDKQKKELRDNGIDFVDISIGDPDMPAPGSVLDTLAASAKIKDNQKYALDTGKTALRNAIKLWSKARFDIDLDENREILPLIGSKEGLVHFPMAFVNRGDYLIIPDPGYPGYRGAAIFSGAKVFELALREKNRFLPDLETIPNRVRNKAKILYLNYPNNPTSALAPNDFLQKVVSFCAKYGIILAYDNAYSEIYFEQKPVSIFEIKGAKEIAIEFHSFSKTFCMTGFRLGWACGNETFIKGLLKVKSNIDSGVFGAIQEAGTIALLKEGSFASDVRATIKGRRDFFMQTLKSTGFPAIYSDATFYVWAKLPRKQKSSIDFARYLMNEKRIVATPGVGFGRHGEGFIRFALTVPADTLKKAAGLLASA